MKTNTNPEVLEVGIVPALSDALTLSRAEIDMQISTAKRYPRDLERFEHTAAKLVEMHMSLSKDPAEGLYYVLQRGGKDIVGPNVRLAEIIAHSYGNCRAGARCVAEDEKFVTAEAVFHDLETNVAIRFESKRRITRRDGSRFDDDMVGVTQNAACGIAFRNAVLKGVPKAIWWRLYLQARKLAGGTTKSDTAERRKKALETCARLKIPEAALLKTLGVKKTSEIESEQLATLVGILTAIQHRETTIDKAFGMEPAPDKQGKSAVKETPAGAVISQNQAMDIMTLLQDYHLRSMDLRRALDGVGHKKDINALPAAKMPALLKALEAMKR